MRISIPKILKNRFADLQLVLVALFWGSSFFMIKDMLDQISPITLVAYRFLFASAILLVYLIATKRKLFQHLGQGIVLGILLFAAFAPQAIGLESTSSANSAFITGLFVAFTPLFSFLILKEKQSAQSLFAIFVATVGLWILTGGISGIKSGELITLITPVSVGLYNVVASRFMKKDSDSWVLNFQQFVAVSLFSFLVAGLTGDSLTPDFGKVGPTLVYLAVFPTIVSYVLQLQAQKTVSATKVGIITSLEPVFGSILAWTVGGETFVWASAIGGILIFSGMIISELPSGFVDKLLSRKNKL